MANHRNVQAEVGLACKVAANHDLSDSVQLLHSPGWATLMTILESSGERPPKRSYDTHNGHSSLHQNQNANSAVNGSVAPALASSSLSVDQLAKRVKRSSLGEGG